MHGYLAFNYLAETLEMECSLDEADAVLKEMGSDGPEANSIILPRANGMSAKRILPMQQGSSPPLFSWIRKSLKPTFTRPSPSAS